MFLQETFLFALHIRKCSDRAMSMIYPESYTAASRQPWQRLTVDRGQCKHCHSFKVHESLAQYVHWNT